LLVVAAVLLVCGGTTVLSCVWYVGRDAHGHVYAAGDVPPAPVALVLGALVEPDGSPSAFLTARLELAKRLYDSGKVRVLLVSGDHTRPDYDETDAMRAWLLAHGVPARVIVVDPEGVDTYDSCARANRIFGVRQAVVVTQTFHVDRAVTLCRQLGIDAVGVGDDSVRGRWLSWYRSSVREQGACVKAVVDLATARDPKFLGPPENGVRDALRSG
jgi:vancomycin permeability regulator SanA